MPRLALALLALLVFVAPTALARETLASLEEPHKGRDRVWDVSILQEEADAPRALVFRNPVGSVFALIVYDSTGEEVFIRNGSRGLQTLPTFEPGQYKFFVRGDGEFQVTDKAFEKTMGTSVETTLEGTDAYVLSPSRPYEVNVTGDVQVEWWDMRAAREDVRAPFTRFVALGGAYVLTVRGLEGAPYSISLTEAEPPARDETPLPALAALAAVALGVALRRRR